MKGYVTILYDGNKEEIELSKRMTTYDIVKRLGRRPDNIIVVRGNMPIPIDEELQEGDILRLVQVASGG